MYVKTGERTKFPSQRPGVQPGLTGPRNETAHDETVPRFLSDISPILPGLSYYTRACTPARRREIYFSRFQIIRWWIDRAHRRRVRRRASTEPHTNRSRRLFSPDDRPTTAKWLHQLFRNNERLIETQASPRCFLIAIAQCPLRQDLRLDASFSPVGGSFASCYENHSGNSLVSRRISDWWCFDRVLDFF